MYFFNIWLQTYNIILANCWFQHQNTPQQYVSYALNSISVTFISASQNIFQHLSLNSYRIVLNYLRIWSFQGKIDINIFLNAQNLIAVNSLINDSNPMALYEIPLPKSSESIWFSGKNFSDINGLVIYILGKQYIFSNEKIGMKQSNIKSTAFVIFAFGFLCVINGAIMGGSCQTASPCCDDNTINVNGVGKVSVQPDIAYITVAVTITAKTSQSATQSVADKISQIIQILTSFNIPKTDIKTQSINIYPQYNYPNGLQTLVGQTASQTLIATVRNIDKTGGDLGKIIDQLVKVDGIQFNSLTFDKEDKTVEMKEARRLAFADAKQKAVDLAAMSERVLGKVLTVVDSTSEPSSQASAAPVFALKSTTATQVPVGDIDIFYYLNIKFALN